MGWLPTSVAAWPAAPGTPRLYWPRGPVARPRGFGPEPLPQHVLPMAVRVGRLSVPTSVAAWPLGVCRTPAVVRLSPSAGHCGELWVRVWPRSPTGLRALGPPGLGPGAPWPLGVCRAPAVVCLSPYAGHCGELWVRVSGPSSPTGLVPSPRPWPFGLFFWLWILGQPSMRATPMLRRWRQFSTSRVRTLNSSLHVGWCRAFVPVVLALAVGFPSLSPGLHACQAKACSSGLAGGVLLHAVLS